MSKRFILSALCALIIIIAGCQNAGEGGDFNETASPAPISAPPEEVDNIIGYVIGDDGDINSYMSMHGFLKTAENLGYPSRLFRFDEGESALSAVDEAIDEGCKGLVIQNANGENDDAVRAALSKDVFVVVPYDVCAVEGLNGNVAADNSEYIEELARGIAERMKERNLSAGRILVYGTDPAPFAPEFERAVLSYYPQYSASVFRRTKADENEAADELAQYLLHNRDVKGLYAIDADGAAISVLARKRAQDIFKTFKPEPSATPDANGNPPSLNDELLNKISITIFGTNISEGNLKLFDSNDISALCIEPYYESAAQSVMMLDKLFKGETVAGTMRINRPIVRTDTVEKYAARYEQVKEWFEQP